MRSEGFVTVVPVERTAAQRGRTGAAGKAAEWSSREQSPNTARQRSKGSRRDPSPYGQGRTYRGRIPRSKKHIIECCAQPTYMHRISNE
jgi:hypothetical protein